MLKIGFLVEKRYLRQEMTTALARALGERGAIVDIICPQDCRFDPETGLLRNQNGTVHRLDKYNVIVPRIRSPFGLALLSYAEAARIPIVNSYAGVQKARDKTKVAIALAHAGVRTAPTIFADEVSVLAELPADWYPLILKAIHGDNSQGLRLIRKPEDLDLISWGDELVLAQHYLPNNGLDLKLYACGKTVFASRKPSPFNGAPGAVLEPIQPDSDMVKLVLQVGAALGLEVFGVDAIETPNGSIVIEVNDFPNFTGVPGSAARIADYIIARFAEARPAIRFAPPVHQGLEMYARARV